MKKISIIIGIVFALLVVGMFFINRVDVGRIKNGKVEYSKRVVSVTKYKSKILIEFDNNLDLIDNCIMSTELYNDFKNGSKDIYNLSLRDYNKLSNLSAKESYNIHKAIDLKLVTEDTKYSDYFAVTCGFSNKRELLKYTKAVMNLASKEN